MYGVHRLQCTVVSQYRVFPRCTTALGYLQQVTVVFATPRNYDISSLLFLGPVSTKGKVIFVSLILVKVQNLCILLAHQVFRK